MAFRSQAARDAQASGYGNERYWRYLDEHAQRTHDYFVRYGDQAKADEQFTRPLGAALTGNDGE